jgi:hypothetical protein
MGPHQCWWGGGGVFDFCNSSLVPVFKPSESKNNWFQVLEKKIIRIKELPVLIFSAESKNFRVS